MHTHTHTHAHAHTHTHTHSHPADKKADEEKAAKEKVDAGAEAAGEEKVWPTA